MKRVSGGMLVFVTLACWDGSAQTDKSRVSPSAPLVIGETFTIESQALGEARRINGYLPSAYSQSPHQRFPVLYMLDGGLGEDFLHVAGLVQVSTGNGTMRPFILIGIENTQRRRDLTGPTENNEDKKIAPQVGGSASFRRFIRTELMPAVKDRYRTTGEAAVMGESLAGLFIIETLFLEPALFDTYIAFDPSLWWNNESLLKSAAARLGAGGEGKRSVFLANSNEKDLARETRELADLLKKHAPATWTCYYEPMTEEGHGTIYHPAALKALRRLFKP